MKSNHSLFLFLLLFLAACGNNKQNEAQDDDVNTASSFIRAALDGKFKEAQNYMLLDSINNNYLDIAARNYQKADLDTKTNYRNSSINIHNVTPINNTTTVIVYSNSFKNDHDTLKLLKEKGKWLVDLKYLFEHDFDTTIKKAPISDSLKK